MTKLIDATVWKFALVGVANTAVGMAVMFACYNWLGMDYWWSSAANYVVGSVVSYFLNKWFTFRSREGGPLVMLRFALSIVVCYALAYGVAKPLAVAALSDASLRVQENVAMLAGSGLFVVLNYAGQRFFVFRKR